MSSGSSASPENSVKEIEIFFCFTLQKC
jgi:hypothetical protein